MNSEWLNLRPFNGDIKNGFEELVCQLARREQIPNKSRFLRIAAPDGGVEAYCILTDGMEYGWQAKFFTSMGDVQWSQLDESFKTAFNKHPNLIKYYICTPLDRPDPRITIAKGKHKGQRVGHFMDKWISKVSEWEEYAKSNGRVVEFEYWGNSELFEKLSKKENEGKLHYWFGKNEFSDEWFEQKLDENIKNLGKRYTPELNFELPIAQVFDGISRDRYFMALFNSYLDDLLKKYHKAISHIKDENVKDEIDKIASLILNFRKQCEQIDFVEINNIDAEGLILLLDTAQLAIKDLIQKLYKLDSDLKEERKNKSKYENNTNKFDWDIEYFGKLNSSIYKLIEFLNGKTVQLSNKPIMILTGEAGIGKSHLLADIASKRLKRNQFSILLLGQHFSTEEPWNQIKKQLQISIERDTFLASLNAKAETTQSRILILIDAINEGEGRKLWKNHIAGFISAIKKFSNIGLVFSVRSSYEKLLIPDSLIEKNEIVKITHHGFAHHEYEASKIFFENFEIKQPSIPLLHPEFFNPLFLKLFCEGLSKKGLHEMPDGYEGITTILDFYLGAINNKISEKHDIPEKLEITQKIVKKIASKIADIENTYINFDEAYAIVTQIAKDYSITEPSKFFQDILSEGLLTQNMYWTEDGKSYEGIYISYERFSDHLVCSYLLENHFDKNCPSASFAKGSKLHSLLENTKAAYFNSGMIEALSIQLPELVGSELFELAPYAQAFYVVAEAFIESLIWRKKETINHKLIGYINNIIIKKHGLYNNFISTILLITSQSNHYFNSDFLHEHLLKFSMADRDALWTPFINDQYMGDPEEITSVKRMIDWAWTENKRDNISDESIRLMCQTMFWFLTSTNRILRDCMTKAIICLLENRISVLIILIRTFEQVNDPYILQRVYAVAFGCAVRTDQIESLKELGNCIFESVFNTKNVVPDILLRDYAKGIIDYAIYRGHHFEFDLKRIKPPYKSDLPTSFPSDEETDKRKYDYENKDFKDYYWSQNSILSSMVTEYGRGIANYGDFGRYVFQRGLSDWRVDVNGLSNLAVKWIFDKYGYEVEKHGEFDRTLTHHGRNSHLTERIGKKYQWIAFYEILARVSDNYPFYENHYSEDIPSISYEGPWNPYVRDIDPTMTIKSTSKNKIKKYWWNPVDYSNWQQPNKEWILNTEDLPKVIELINVTDENGIEWLVLEMYPEWNEPVPMGEEQFNSPCKRLFYDLSSHIIHKKDLTNIIQYLSKKNLRGCGLSESKTRYEMFSREYYWSMANNTFNSAYYGGCDWDKLYNKKTGEFICNTARTALKFLWEEEFDASKEEAISFFKPTRVLFNLLDLKYAEIEGQLLNQKNELLCFDPSATISTISCLLVRKNELLEVLAENELEIIWTSIGEKLIIGGHFNSNEWLGRLNISDVIYFNSGKLKSSTYTEREQY